MSRVRRIVVNVVATAALILTTSASQADTFTGTLYFTTFSGSNTDRVHSVVYTYNSATPSFSLSPVHDIITNQGIGADGIIFAPDGTLLIGGQGNHIYNVDPTTGTVLHDLTNTGGGTVYHLALAPDKSTIYGGGTEGGTSGLVKDSVFANGTTQTVTGSNTSITGIAFDGSGNAFYTSSGDNGVGGTFGKLTGLPSSPVTTALTTGLDAAHGIIYDPFTGDFILVGDNEIAQVDALGNIISSRRFSGFGSVFDQGSVDGQGHLFVANNDGNMLFVDYSGTGLVGDASDFTSKNFVDGSLDDLAPLVGLGGSGGQMPEPSTLMLVGVSGLSLLGYRLRRRWDLVQVLSKKLRGDLPVTRA